MNRETAEREAALARSPQAQRSGARSEAQPSEVWVAELRSAGPH